MDYWNKCRFTALALAVFGSAVFPGEAGFIDCRIGPMLDQIDDHHTIVPKILGKLLRSLSYCSSYRRRDFLGCAPLLQIWFLEHLEEFRSIRTKGYFDHDIITDYQRHANDPSRIATKGDWVAALNSLTFEHILESPVARTRWGYFTVWRTSYGSFNRFLGNDRFHPELWDSMG